MESGGTEHVPTIIFELPDAGAFLSAYVAEGEVGGLFVPGEILLEPGTQVRIELVFAKEDRTFRTRGVVRWRRAQGARALEAGVGIEFLPGERATRDFLLEFASGRNVRVVQRRARRLPVRLEVAYASASAFLTDWTEDISDGGLFIRTAEPPETGTALRLRIRVPGKLLAIKLRGEVAWRTDGENPGFGVRFLFDKPTTERKVREVVKALADRMRREVELRAAAGRGRVMPR